MQNFSQTPLLDIYSTLQEHFKRLKPHERFSFVILNPDIQNSLYNGNTITLQGKEYIYRGYKTWLDLAHQLNSKMLTPIQKDENFIIITYEKLTQESFHAQNADAEQKYGKGSIFSEIHKNEEAGFLHTFYQALQNVKIDTRLKILNLGINSGDEFELIKNVVKNFSSLELYGVDYCQSAITQAQQKFQNDSNIHLFTHDINDLASLDLGVFDLIISIGTLQSSNLEYNKLLMSLVQNHLKRSGALILAWPNCRWVDGEMLYGAKMKNYNFSEMSNLYKDVIFAKKYLQQKRFRVTITGKDYIFITATSIR